MLPAGFKKRKEKTNVKQKYELIEITKEPHPKDVTYRIRALKDFSRADGFKVHKGDFGGYISSEENLDQEGNCWIDETSKVTFNAKVSGNALIRYSSSVSESATVKDDAIISHSSVKGEALISDSATVTDKTLIKDHAIVSGSAFIQSSTVCEYAKISGYSEVRNNSRISENAIIKKNAKVTSSLIFGNAIIDYAARVDESIIAENVLVSGNCRIFSGSLFGNYKIGVPNSSEPCYFEIWDAFSDSSHPIFTFPVKAANTTIGFAVFFKNDESPDWPVFASFTYSDAYGCSRNISSMFSDSLVEEFEACPPLFSPTYDISKDRNAKQIKSFLLRRDPSILDNRSASIFKVSNEWAKNFINEVSFYFSIPIPKHEPLFKQIRYYIFGSLLGLLGLDFIPRHPGKKYKYSPEKKFGNLLELSNIDFSTGKITSFIDVVPYNEYMFKIVADVLDLESISCEDFKKKTNSLYI